MTRLFVLCDSSAESERISQSIRDSDIEVIESRTVTRADDYTAPFTADNATLEQTTDVTSARKRSMIVAGLTGAVVGAFLSWQFANYGLSLVGGLLGGALVGTGFGAFIGTLIGVRERNPAVQEFSEQLRRGKTLLSLEIPERFKERAAAIIHSVSPAAQVRVSNLTGAQTV